MTDCAQAPLRVGHRLTPLVVPSIERPTLRNFAAASGDPNPLHLDPTVARASGQPDVIAHGMLSMAYAARLLTDEWGPAALRSWHVRFLAPTPVGRRPTCHGEVLALNAGLAVIRLWVETEDGTVTLSGDAEVSLRRPSGTEHREGPTQTRTRRRSSGCDLGSSFPCLTTFPPLT